MKKIERPDWENILESQTIRRHLVAVLNGWFNWNVEPVNKLLEDAVEVYSDSKRAWSTHPDDALIGNTHKALLIDVQAIKKDSLDDILEDFKKNVMGDPTTDIVEISNRLRKVLETK